MSLKYTGNFGPITGAMKTGDMPPTSIPYEYITHWDPSGSGTGTISSGGTTLSNLAVLTWSRPSYTVWETDGKKVEEIRCRFNNGAANYAMKTSLFEEGYGSLLYWYDNDDSVTYRTTANTMAGAGSIGDGAYKEFRINTITGEYKFMTDNIVRWSIFGRIPQGPIYATAYEGSYSKSSLILLPGLE